MTDDLPGMYFAVRDRILGAASALDDRQLANTVPACPEWTAKDLLTHVVAMPMAIIAGDVPEGPDPNPWLQRLVDDNVHRSVDELAEWWGSDDTALARLVPNAGLLLADLFVHESDLHGAVGSAGPRDAAPELESQLNASLAGLQKHLVETDLPPIGVDTGAWRLASSDGEPGWTLRTSGWEAHRALNSRRTAEEVLALEADGDATPYLQILHDHLPLPTMGLGEH